MRRTRAGCGCARTSIGVSIDAIGRGQQVDAGLGAARSALRKNASSSRWMFSSASTTREPRLGAEEHRGVAVGDVQIDEQRLPGSSFGQRGRDVDRQRRRADAALGADEREAPGRRPRAVCCADEARRWRRASSSCGQRLGDDTR